MAVRIDADGKELSRAGDPPSATTLSLCFWGKITTDRNTFSTFIEVATNSGSYVIFSTDSDGTGLSFYSGGGSPTPIQLTVGTRYFIALAKSSGNVTIYVAADSATSFTTSSTTSAGSPSPSNVRLGESVFGGEWLNGVMQNVKVWSGVALTQAELWQERLSYRPKRTLDLYAWWPLLPGSDAERGRDYSGRGRNLTVTGTITDEALMGLPWGDSPRLVGAPVAAERAFTAAGAGIAVAVAGFTILRPLVVAAVMGAASMSVSAYRSKAWTAGSISGMGGATATISARRDTGSIPAAGLGSVSASFTALRPWSTSTAGAGAASAVFSTSRQLSIAPAAGSARRVRAWAHWCPA